MQIICACKKAFATVPLAKAQVTYSRTNFHDQNFLHVEEHKQKKWQIMSGLLERATLSKNAFQLYFIS